MRNKSRYPILPPQTNKTPPEDVINELIELFNCENWEKLASKTRLVTISFPKYILGWKALGKALLMLGNLSDAIPSFSNVIKLAPVEADAHNDLGYIFGSLGRTAESEDSYRNALKYNPKFSEALNNLAILLVNQGRLDEAETYYLKALEINPSSAETHNNIGSFHKDCGRFKQELACFQHAIELNSNYFDAWFNLAYTQKNLELMIQAQASYSQALTIKTNSDIALNALGELLINMGDKEDVATYCLQRAIEINPNNADSCVNFGNLLTRTGQTDDARTMFRRAKELRPVITWHAKNPNADFSVLLLDTPHAGNTPIDYLLNNAPYESHFYCLLEDDPLNNDFLPTKIDVLVNLISDADNGKDLLPVAINIVDSLGLPVVNHPSKIMNTDRETIAKLINDIPFCKAPQTIMLTGFSIMEAVTNNSLGGLNMPLLVRLAGCHGGDNCEKFTEFTAIADYVSKHPGSNYYVSEYIDYQSTDGFFRKYRLIYVNDALFPYHLAIHDQWLVHHFRTDMSNQDWMLQEEESFLKNPYRVFDQTHLTALIALAISTGLDYIGIDCSLDQNGGVLVFEANATMRVHYENNDIYAYTVKTGLEYTYKMNNILH